MRRPAIIGWILLTAALPACADTRPEGGARSVQIDTLPSGLVAVTNHEPSWTAETAWTLEEDLRIGSVDGAENDQFGQIARITTDTSSRIYVLDYQAQEIRVFEPDGRFSHTIGSRGPGPGEFGGALGLSWAPGGQLWVWDPGGRYSVFDRDGTFVASHQRLVVGLLYPWRGGFRPDGRFYDWTIARPGDGPGGIGQQVLFYPMRVSRDFKTVDTLPPLEYRTEFTSNNRPVPFGGRVTFYHDLAGRVWFARTREYRVYERTVQGDTTRTFDLPATAAPVTRAEADSIVAWQRDNWPPELRTPREDIPDGKPIVHRIFGDDGGHLFIVVEVDGAPAGTIVDVFTDQGVYLGRMEFPSVIALPQPPPHATDDHIYVVVTDELDVPYVSRLRIVRP